MKVYVTEVLPERGRRFLRWEGERPHWLAAESASAAKAAIIVRRSWHE